MTEFEVDIMNDGTIRFGRRDPQTNEAIYDLVSRIAPHQASAVREFLDCAKQTEQIFGDEPLCG